MEEYEELAKRNGWIYSMSDGRPYFMKDGDYASPDETTSKEDKDFLAEIISEGSNEMKKTILMCWENGITISGPCSGITDYHKGKDVVYVHFSFAGEKEKITELYQKLQVPFPDFHHSLSERKGLTRYDFVYQTEPLALEESNGIFEIVNEALKEVYKVEDQKTY